MVILCAYFFKEAIISETNTPDIGSDEVSTKINPFQTVNHVITVSKD